MRSLHFGRVSGFIILVAAGWVGTAAAQSRLEFRDGLVYLWAQNVPVPDILRTWERVGGTKILFAERLPSDPVTIQLERVSESRALDELLSKAVGFLARERAAPASGRSRYALLLVLAESDVRDGGAAARRAMDEALRQVDNRIVDFRDLPPRDPTDPNVPVALTPASVGDTAPPPLAFPADDAEMLKAAGGDPGVNPIPPGLPPPAPTPSRPAPSDATLGVGPQNLATPPTTTSKPGSATKPVKPPGPPKI